ncbi:HD-GYP domain-containing protein [Clostridiisalibacter paucivorans]|uniref:HD-GYP domain-containing protein n=1 Tax=Clostridiisalibacter paucivorans TaxID=408753 RepID=UPI00047B0C5B|nr:HD-GYP domain-containing protein [Clostridiisalibacter paucivorans]
MRLIPVNSIRPGCILGKTIHNSEGQVLLYKGVKLTKELLKRIEDNEIYSLYIKDKYSEGEIEDNIKPELRQKAIKTIRDNFSSIENYVKQESILSTKKVIDLKHKYLSSFKIMAEEIVEEILSNRKTLVNLVDIKTMDGYTYEHSVNVAVLSIILGVELGLNKPRLVDLANGALLHDLGKVFISKDILLKKGKLDSTEYDEMKNHPIMGYKYLKTQNDISSISRVIVLQHHERIDGLGYPKSLTGNEINYYAKIVSISDVYDALTSDRPYRRGLPPNEAIEYLMGTGGSIFDAEMVELFVKNIVPYPVGTLVDLSNGDVGLVEKLNTNFPLRPILRIIDLENDEKTETVLDMMSTKNIVIIGTNYESFSIDE